MKIGKCKFIDKIIAMRNRKIAAKKLGASMRRVLEEEITKNRAEMAQGAPYFFSKEFENSMLKVMEVRKRKPKIYKTLRYAAVTLVTVLFIGGILFVGNEEARASKMGMEIQAWLDNFFVVEEKSKESNDVLFEEAQIGYLPDGFEKVSEEVTFSYVLYKYQSDSKDYIILGVYRDKTLSGIDNEEIGQDIDLNAAGLEYRFIDKAEKNAVAVAWTDKKDVYYCLISTLEKEEIINIMDGISYQ